MKRVFQLLCFSAFLCFAITAQNQNASDIPGALAVSAGGDWSPVQGLKGLKSGFTHCDAKGNMYIALEQPHRYDHRPALYRVSPDGHIQASFSQPSVALGSTHTGQAFAQNGAVVMLEVAHESEYLLWFKPHGEMMSRTALQWRSLAGRIGLFPNGNVLITYHDRGLGKGDHQHEMHTGVYDVRGNLVAEVKLPDDEAIKNAVANGDSRFAANHQGSNLAVDLSELASGTDGNVYLLRGHSNPALVYAIDSKGNLVRRLEIQAPFPTMFPHNLQADKGEIVLVFNDPQHAKRVVSVNDWNTGARLRLYDITGVGGAYACFKPETERLTFLRVNPEEDGQISVRFAYRSGANVASR